MSYLSLRPWRRHSLVLSVAGAVYILIGVAYILIPATPERRASLQVPLALAPLWVWGVVFVLVGVLAIISSRWPPASETWGYAVMSGLATLWGAFIGFSALLSGSIAGVTGVAVWILLAFLWWAVSGLTNPTVKPYDLQE